MYSHRMVIKTVTYMYELLFFKYLDSISTFLSIPQHVLFSMLDLIYYMQITQIISVISQSG